MIVFKAEHNILMHPLNMLGFAGNPFFILLSGVTLFWKRLLCFERAVGIAQKTLGGVREKGMGISLASSAAASR